MLIYNPDKLALFFQNVSFRIVSKLRLSRVEGFIIPSTIGRTCAFDTKKHEIVGVFLAVSLCLIRDKKFLELFHFYFQLPSLLVDSRWFYRCLSRTFQAGGISSGTSHLLPQRWHLSISGLLGLPQLAQVTSVIFGRVSRYVIYAGRPKTNVPASQNLLVFLDKPIIPASLVTRQPSRPANKIPGSISIKTSRSL
jgi:hypothetical protein